MVCSVAQLCITTADSAISAGLQAVCACVLQHPSMLSSSCGSWRHPLQHQAVHAYLFGLHAPCSSVAPSEAVDIALIDKASQQQVYCRSWCGVWRVE